MFGAVRLRLKGWKTIIAQSVVGLPALLFFLYSQFATVDFTPLVPAKYVALFVVCNAVAGVALRIWATSGEYGEKRGLDDRGKTVPCSPNLDAQGNVV